MKIFRNKRSSLSLSMNAIVVLIISVIMLSLILTFITKGMGAAEKKFFQEIEKTPDPSADPSAPIGLSHETLFVSPGDKSGLKIAVYNPSNFDWGPMSCTLDDDGQCTETGCVLNDDGDCIPELCVGIELSTVDNPTDCKCIETTCSFTGEGVAPTVSCGTKLELVSPEVNLRKIPVADQQVFTYLFDISKKAVPKQYLCEVMIPTKDNPLYYEDLKITVEK